MVDDHDEVWFGYKQQNSIYDQDKQLNWLLGYLMAVEMVVALEEEEANDDVDENEDDDDDDDEQKDRNEINRFDDDVDEEYGRDLVVVLKHRVQMVHV